MNICDYLAQAGHKLVFIAIVLGLLMIRLTANRPQVAFADPMDAIERHVPPDLRVWRESHNNYYYALQRSTLNRSSSRSNRSSAARRSSRSNVQTVQSFEMHSLAA